MQCSAVQYSGCVVSEASGLCNHRSIILLLWRDHTWPVALEWQSVICFGTAARPGDGHAAAMSCSNQQSRFVLLVMVVIWMTGTDWLILLFVWSRRSLLHSEGLVLLLSFVGVPFRICTKVGSFQLRTFAPMQRNQTPTFSPDRLCAARSTHQHAAGS